MQKDEHYFMQRALVQAKTAGQKGEVPVGAVIVKDGNVIARGYNLREHRQDALAHAEVIAIQRACARLGTWRLEGCTLFVTLEPCPMCAGAIINSRLERIVFGAYDEKAGCCTTLYHLPTDERFNHRVQVLGGVDEEACAHLLKQFFADKRVK